MAFCLSSSLARAQTSDLQASEDQSWTTTSDLNSNNANPTRSTESHTQSGNRTVDTKSLQRRGSNGGFEPYQDIETETIKVNSTTTRTTIRTFGRDSDGRKTLVQVREEEKRSTPDGNSSVMGPFLQGSSFLPVRTLLIRASSVVVRSALCSARL